MKAPRLLLRANASAEIGTGHVMRCLALAQAWQRHGGRVHFLLGQPLAGLDQKLAEAGCEAAVLADSPALGSVADAAQAIAHAQQIKADWVVVDGYHFDAAYQEALKQAGLRVLFIDDYGPCDFYSADVVLNQNIYATQELYAQRAAETELLLGCRYALLRAEFRPWLGWRREIAPVAQNLLVTLGGADSNNQTLKVLQGIGQVTTSLHVTVLVGAANPHRLFLDEVAEQLRPLHTVELVQNAADMPERIASADMGVCAGGSTCWEMSFLGLPTAVLTIAENQRPIAAGLHEAGIAHSLGWFEDVTAADIAAVLHKLSADEAQRREMSQRGQQLVDGYGTERVVAELLRHRGGLVVRPALPEDAQLLWEWANEAAVRHNAFNPEPIPWEVHLKWLAQKLEQETARLWIIEQNGQPVAQIRYDDRGDGRAEIGYSVAQGARGQGLGSKVLQETAALACHALGVSTVYGVVFQANHASRRAFIKAGFTQLPQPVLIQNQMCEQFEWMMDDNYESLYRD